MFAVLYLGYRRIRRSYWAYALVYFLVLISSSYLLGLPRYCAGMFPLYFIFGALAEQRPRLGWVLTIMFAMFAPVVYFAWTSWSYAF